LRIADDGVGIEPLRKKRGGLGLAGLRERVEALGGRLEIVSCVPHGLEVRVHIPAAGVRP
jgi:two-component system sensor histidine kinase UhpB